MFRRMVLVLAIAAAVTCGCKQDASACYGDFGFGGYGFQQQVVFSQPVFFDGGWGGGWGGGWEWGGPRFAPVSFSGWPRGGWDWPQRDWGWGGGFPRDIRVSGTVFTQRAPRRASRRSFARGFDDGVRVRAPFTDVGVGF